MNKISRVLFVTSFDYPSRFAHAIHGLHMARAYHLLFPGAFLYLVNIVSERGALTGVPFRSVFGSWGRWVRKMRLRTAALALYLCYTFLTMAQWRGRSVLVVTTDPSVGVLLVLLSYIFRFKTAVELHARSEGVRGRILAHADAVVCVTAALEHEFKKAFPGAQTLVVPNAVDREAFDAVPDEKDSLRTELHLPRECVLLGYVGRLEPRGEEKGTHILIDALALLPEDHYLVLVGATRAEEALVKKAIQGTVVASRVLIVPHVSYHLVPHYMKACDILLYTPAARSAFYTTETSPMKLFEYMAAQRPVILSRMPAFMEVIDDTMATLIEEVTPEAVAAAVREVRLNPITARGKLERAYAAVKSRTWSVRAERIVQEVARMV